MPLNRLTNSPSQSLSVARSRNDRQGISHSAMFHAPITAPVPRRPVLRSVPLPVHVARHGTRPREGERHEVLAETRLDRLRRRSRGADHGPENRQDGPAIGGQTCGDVGAYERLVGASRASSIRPIPLMRLSGTSVSPLLFEADNRGNKLAPVFFNDGVAGGVLRWGRRRRGRAQRPHVSWRRLPDAAVVRPGNGRPPGQL